LSDLLTDDLFLLDTVEKYTWLYCE